MRKTLLAVVLVAVLLFAAQLAFAQESPTPPPAREAKGLGALDKNGDGLIAKDEWTRGPELFDRLDANGDGKLDSVEIAAAKQKADELRRKLDERRGEARGPLDERRGERRGPEAPGGPEAANADRLRQRAHGAAMFAAELFKIIDADKDGKLSSAEIDAFSAKIKEADADKDGSVTKDEAKTYIKNRFAQRIGDAFMKKFDKDANGKVTAEEYTGNDKTFKWLDADKDGAITIQDFEKRGPAALERKRAGDKADAKRDERGMGERRRERDAAPARGEEPRRPDDPERKADTPKESPATP